MRFNRVEGFLARRPDYEGDLAILVMRDPLREDSQREAIALAETPALVLLVAPESSVEAARSYLEGIEGIGRVELHVQTTELP